MIALGYNTMKTDPTILILLGKGKTTLANFIKKVSQSGINLEIIEGTETLKKDVAQIKSNGESGICTIINLQSESDLKTVPLGLRRRAVVFNLSF